MGDKDPSTHCMEIVTREGGRKGGKTAGEGTTQESN